jgi:hypothetical protein
MRKICFINNSKKISKLDKEFIRKIQTLKDLLPEAEFNDRFDTYELISVQMMELSCEHLFDEIKYRVTDGENINDVLIEILTKLDDREHPWFLKKELISYSEEDRYAFLKNKPHDEKG